MKILFLALFLFAAPLVVLAEDCATCTAAKICAEHAASDLAALKALGEAMRNPDPVQRAEAVDAFATACRTHMNCRPPANAAALGAMMKDASPSVRARAGWRLGEQDPKTAGKILDKEVETLIKLLAKEPKGTKEENAWLAGFEVIQGISAGLGEMSVAPAGAIMSKILASVRLKVIEVACADFPKIKDKAIGPGVVSAIDHVRLTTGVDDRDRVWLKLLDAWELLTGAKIRHPKDFDPSDAARYVTDCQRWWREHEKDWK